MTVVPALARDQEKDNYLYLRVSDRGLCAGLVTLSTSDVDLFLVVLPKIWRQGRPVLHTLELAGGSQTITVYELDSVRIEAPAAVLGRLTTAVTNLGDDDRAPLLAVGRPRNSPPARKATNAPEDLPNLLELARLERRSRLAQTSRSRTLVENHASQSAVFTADAFLSSAHRVIQTAVPRYEQRSEILLSLRGRLDTRSVATAGSTHDPRVLCHYDELTLDTPLLQVIRSAARVAVSLRIGSPLDQLALRLPERGTRLIRRLDGVTPLAPGQALHLGRTLRLSRFEQPWTQALAEALRLLDLVASFHGGTGESTNDLVLRIPTERLWENVVDEILRVVTVDVLRNSDNVLAEGADVLSPWIAPDNADKNSYPDYLAVFGNTRLVLDAKYKKAPKAPGSSDANQIFVYSHLSEHRAIRVRHAALIYPTALAPGHRFLARRDDSGTILGVISLQFPQPYDLRSAPAWSLYKGRAADALRTALEDLGRVPSRPDNG